MMQKMQVDKGAIRFILGGANIMCPGFTSPGGIIPEGLLPEIPVVSCCCILNFNCLLIYSVNIITRQYTWKARSMQLLSE